MSLKTEEPARVQRQENAKANKILVVSQFTLLINIVMIGIDIQGVLTGLNEATLQQKRV